MNTWLVERVEFTFCLFDASDYKCKYTFIIENLGSIGKDKEMAGKLLPIISLSRGTIVNILKHILLFFSYFIILP